MFVIKGCQQGESRLYWAFLRVFLGCATSKRISANRPVNLIESNNLKGNTCKSSQLVGKTDVAETIVGSLLAAYLGRKCTSNSQRLRIAGDSDRRSKCFCSWSNPVLCVAFTRQMVGRRDQITSGRRWKRVLLIPFIFSGSPNEFWPHTFDACVITNLEIRIAGDERSPQ